MNSTHHFAMHEKKIGSSPTLKGEGGRSLVAEASWEGACLTNGWQ